MASSPTYVATTNDELTGKTTVNSKDIDVNLDYVKIPKGEILNYTTVPILIGWGILGTIYVFFIHPLILRFVRLFKPKIMRKIALILSLIFICDLIISTKRIDVNPNILNDLVNPENAKIEMIFYTE